MDQVDEEDQAVRPVARARRGRRRGRPVLGRGRPAPNPVVTSDEEEEEEEEVQEVLQEVIPVAPVRRGRRIARRVLGGRPAVILREPSDDEEEEEEEEEQEVLQEVIPVAPAPAPAPAPVRRGRRIARRVLGGFPAVILREPSDDEEEEEEEEVQEVLQEVIPVAPAPAPAPAPVRRGRRIARRVLGGFPAVIQAVIPVEPSDDEEEEEEQEEQEVLQEVLPVAPAPRRLRIPFAGGRPVMNPVRSSDEEDEEEEEEEENPPVIPVINPPRIREMPRWPVVLVVSSDEEEDDEDDDVFIDEEEPEFTSEDGDGDSEYDVDDGEVEEVDDGKEKNVEDVFGFERVYKIYFKLQKLVTKYQLERSARGLPIQEIPLFDPSKIYIGNWQLLLEPEGPLPPIDAAFKKQCHRLEDLVNSIAGEEREPRYEKLFRKPGEFKLPDGIRERLKTGQVQIIESSIDALRDALVNGMELKNLDLFTIIHMMARLNGASDSLIPEGKLNMIVDGTLHTNEFKTRRRAYERRRKGRIFEREELREMEAQEIFVPLIPNDDYHFWTEYDVSDWIKHFVPLQAHRNLIEVQHFTGHNLDKFLGSETEWIKAGWPFGLFIQVKTHFNRVVNRRNGWPYLVR